MSRRLSTEREQEFEELLAFLEFHMEHLRRHRVAPPTGLTVRSVSEQIAGEHGRSKALEGARQAVNDAIEELAHLKPENVTIVDEALRAAGLVTLSELRRRYSSTFRRIVNRGSIKTQTEYHLANGLVVDLASNLTPSERQQLQTMIDAYEG
jgi:hypothetical protein